MVIMQYVEEKKVLKALAICAIVGAAIGIGFGIIGHEKYDETPDWFKGITFGAFALIYCTGGMMSEKNGWWSLIGGVIGALVAFAIFMLANQCRAAITAVWFYQQDWPCVVCLTRATSIPFSTLCFVIMRTALC
jgi:hypothetical protein